MRTGAIVGALLVVLAGCDRSDINDYSCTDPDKGHLDAEGKPDPCHHHDLDAGAPGDGGPPVDTCDRQCVPRAGADWTGPVLLWTGAEADAPLCPSLAGNFLKTYTGHADPKPPTCGACACKEPDGSCALPATLTASSAPCPGTAPGAVHTSFDPPAGWSGTCTAANAIPAGALCGGVPCVRSVTIAPLTLSNDTCEPIQPDGYQSPATWGRFALACSGEMISGRCASIGDGVCVRPAPGPEFTQCVFRHVALAEVDGVGCDPGYPEKSVFYEGFADFAQACEPCTCEPATGSTCTGSIALFKDAACGVPLLGPVIPIDSTGSKCFDLPAGSPLGSKQVNETSYLHGACAPSGGGLKPEASPVYPTIFCCQSTP
jgi:hypothetical protein